MTRITADRKRQTRERIVESARVLFRERGFDETTTRDIAAAAEIGTGTLFNYYPTKEALALALLSESLDLAEAEFAGRPAGRGREPLEEALFGYIATGLRHLAAHRPNARAVLDSTMSPFGAAAHTGAADEVRNRHIETVQQIVSGRGRPPMSSFDLHLYWTLYLGVLAFWAADDTPNQEATLAVLDQTMRLFALALGASEGAGAVARARAGTSTGTGSLQEDADDADHR